MPIVPLNEFAYGQHLTSEPIQALPTRQDETRDSVDDDAVNLIGQWSWVAAAASEYVNRQEPAVRVAVSADMAFVDEDDGSEPGRTLRAVELRDVRMDLSNAGSADTVSQNLKHPLAVVIDGR